jgi:hypothetical protein
MGDFGRDAQFSLTYGRMCLVYLYAIIDRFKAMTLFDGGKRFEKATIQT